MSEQWRPIPGWEGYYSASTEGRIRSEARTVTRSNGALQPWHERVLSAGTNSCGRLTVRLMRNGVGRSLLVHKLVMLAFVGPCPDGLEVLHYDDDPLNNRLSNLRYGTRSENQLDSVRNGRHAQAAKTHCIHGHEYTPMNTGRDRGQRYCRTCRAIRSANKKGTAA